MARRVRKLHLAQSPDEGLTLVPFGVTINGTSDPDGLVGDSIATATRSEAGEFALTFRDEYPVCIYADASVSTTADDVDMYVRCDWSSFASAGTLVVRTFTGATQTDPSDNLLIGGFALVRKTTRQARGR